MFQMESYKSVHDMYTRFTDIVNSLETLGKAFTNCEKVKKISSAKRVETQENGHRRSKIF